MNDDILWFDTETSGLDPNAHSILQIGLAWNDRTYVSYVKPQTDQITDGALKANGLAREQLPTFPESVVVAQEAYDFISWIKMRTGKRLILGGHNVTFDRNFIRTFYRRLNHQGWDSLLDYFSVDTITMAHMCRRAGLFRSADLKLTTLAQALAIETPHAHDALADVLTTRAVYQKLVAMIKPSDRAESIQPVSPNDPSGTTM